MKKETDRIDHWPPSLVLLHCATAILALMVAALAVFLLSPPNWSQLYVDRYMAWIGWHRLGGLVVLLSGIFWIVVRIRTPRPPRRGAPWVRRASRLTHAALLSLLIALPVSGYVMDSLVNAWLVLPMGISLPSALSRHEELSIATSYAHKWGGFALLGLAAMHIVAALVHAMRPGDRTLQRMLPWFPERS